MLRSEKAAPRASRACREQQGERKYTPTSSAGPRPLALESEAPLHSFPGRPKSVNAVGPARLRPFQYASRIPTRPSLGSP